jgi:hypothetical protein
MDLAKCGVFTKPGCPADSAPYLSSVPKCLNADVGPLVDYCRQYPQFNGDNKQANAACWAMSRYQDVYQKVMALGPCPSPSVTVAPPVYQPAPPPPSAAPPAYQPPPPSDMPPPQQSSAPPGSPEATPGPIDVAPPDSGSSVTTDAGAPPPAPQKSNMMMWGLAGAAALGVGYLIFRKK